MKLLTYIMKLRQFFVSALFVVAALGNITTANAAVTTPTNLADKPLFAVGTNLTGNVALALSVEFPTALGSAYTTGYSISGQDYLGYFDPNKCYAYYISGGSSGNYFKPVATTTGHDCTAVTSGRWSGNFLNWALTQTIDPFRATLTGGYRAVDIVGLTVLEKAWATGQGGTVATPTISNNATLISQSTPFTNLSTLVIRIAGLGNQFYFTGSTSTNINSPSSVQADSTVTATPTSSKVYSMYARVQACSPTLLESSCTLYPNGDYKPTGLIQKNSLKLNFAAFGYLLDGNILRDGGVMRARMAALGPTMKSGSTIVNNPNTEWDLNTGIFIQNPDPADATASGVTNSGVINYLNKFGLTNKSYKGYDPVGELYYATTRYFRKKGNVASYTSGANSTMIDGFPVITAWDDPVKDACQSNFIIGVGDTNTHADADLPGSTIKSSNEPTTTPAEVIADTGSLSNATNATTNYMDVRVSTNQVGAIEGVNKYGNLGERYTPWCCNNNTFFMAGIAYDVHTRDIRPDLTGMQTITTYWLDVLESGDEKDAGGVGMRNQFWLTAKYGGFDVPTGFQPYNGVPVLNTAWWDNSPLGGDGDPDNYFRANNPALMQSGLSQAFDSIINTLKGSSISFATSAPAVQSGSLTYATAYSSDGWTGDVIASQLSVSNTGVVTSSKVWNAVDKLETQASGSGWDGARFVATSTCSPTGTAGMQTCAGVPFRLGGGSTGISTNQANALSATGTNQQSILNFLRGDRSNAGALGAKLYRDRVKILGDIVNSKAVPVAAPNRPYIDTFNPGYSTFKANNANRTTTVYVGGNDGMLHAFNGTVAGGSELFSYIPNALFQGPNNTPTVDGLAKLGDSTYGHLYYVDATPAVADVDFGNGSGDWHSLLISGLGKGGKSYFAIDVTNPNSLSNETNLAAAVKWEFTHQDMGYTYDTPLVIKTAQYGWVVVLTSGYNNVDGKGYFFLVRPSDGTLLAEIPVNDPSQVVGTDAGLAHVNAFVGDGRSGLADAIYAGDLFGNVWRVDLTGTTYTAIKIAKLTAPDGSAQPVTTSPIVELDTNTSKRYVFVGTGRLLDASDMTRTQTQTFYAINDGTLSSFYTASTLPSGVTFPIQRADLNDDTGTILTGIGSNPAKLMGYYVDLGTSNGKPYFINAEMASASGVVAFVANVVDSSDACNPSGSNLTYALSYGTGQSVFFQKDANGNTVYDATGSKIPVANVAGVGLGVNVAFVKVTYKDSTGTDREYTNVVTSNDQGGSKGSEINLATSKAFTQLNWRELPVSE